MNLYVNEQGMAEVKDLPKRDAVRLQVRGIRTTGGEVLYLDPAAAKLLGNELITHALRVQVAQLKKGVK